MIRALRLPFTAASALPYVFGSLLGNGFDPWLFALGLLAVVAVHLSANVVNDYADSRSGADWSDRRYYGFFGGSKLIQEGVLTERFYRRAAIVLAAVAAAAVTGAAARLRNPLPAAVVAAALAAAWAYSVLPLKLSYRGAGEVVILVLFGPVAVGGGCYLQGGGLFPARALALSLPFGLLTTAILVANEVPDREDDLRAGKRTLVGRLDPGGGAVLYGALTAGALLAVAGAVAADLAGPAALAALGMAAPAWRAARILRRPGATKQALLESSRLAILVQALVGAILIGERLLWPRS